MKHGMQPNFSLLLLIACLICVGSLGAQASRSSILPYRTVNAFRTSPSDENRRLFFDHFGMLWIGTSSGLKSYDGYDLRTIKSTAANPSVLPHNTVLSITEDRRHNLWIGTRNGVVRMDEDRMSFTTYPPYPRDYRIVTTLYTSPVGQVWMGNRGGLLRYDVQHDRFVLYNDRNAYLVDLQGRRHRMLKSYSVQAITENAKGEIFIGTWGNGVFRFDPASRTFYAYPRVNSRQSAYSLFFDSHQRLWIGSWGLGLQRMDHPENRQHPVLHSFYRGKGSFDTFYKIIEDPVTKTVWSCTREGIYILGLNDDFSKMRFYNSYLLDNVHALPLCNDLMTDGQGNIWIETLYDGIVHLSTVPSPFLGFNLMSTGYSSPVNSVCSIFTNDGRRIWMTMKPYGIACHDRLTGATIYNRSIPGFAPLPDDFMMTSITSVVQRYNGEIWFANNGYGIERYMPGQTVELIRNNRYPGLINNYIQTLMSSSSRIMWIGQGSGVSLFYPDNRCVALRMMEHGKDLTNCCPQQIIEDHHGTVWVSSDNEGIIRITGNAFYPSSLHYHQYCKDKGNLAVNDVTACYEDSRHRLWAISNSGGLFLYNSSKDRFYSMNATYHIPGDRIFTIQEDRQGALWLSTDNALVCIPAEKKQASRIFGEEDGLPRLLFYPTASCSFGEEFFLACRNGYFSFSPDHFVMRRRKPHTQMIVSDIILNEQSLADMDSAKRVEISKSSARFTKRVTIPAGENKLDFVVALLSFNNEAQTQYAYMLEGQDTKWRVLNNGHHRISFENLSPGTYTLHLRASDSHGNIYPLPYDIVIRQLPHWYASTPALIFYLLLLAGGLWMGSYWYREHLRIRNRLQMAVVFTNITHELLTPLTVMSATVERMKRKVPQLSDDYGMLTHHIYSITRMLRQILEVRKSQAGQLKLLVSKQDWVPFINNVCHNLEPLCVMHHNRLVLDLPDKPLVGWLDTDKVEKILYNLLSNAFKYNKEEGAVTVRLSADKEHAVLVVADEGMGISPSKYKNLYKRFLDGDYRQANTLGTGIGLSLTHDLVVLHHGSMKCDSVRGSGTVFTVRIPLKGSEYAEDEKVEWNANKISAPADKAQVESLKTMVPANPKRPKDPYRILLVEDNQELLALMAELLHNHYDVLTARNGQQAWNLIQKERLDLVVSDIMMPVMDGLMLTKLIKNSKDYQLLPVILLTAKTGEDDKDEGFQLGADDYIVKPFRLESLELHIDSVLANRKRAKEEWNMRQQKISVQEERKECLSDPDEMFVRKAEACIREHIDDLDYSRDRFAEDMMVSSSTLYNKLRTLTGHNIVEFITNIRLEEAKKLIRAHPQMKMAEVAERTGFSTSKYMTYCFKKKFGVSPKTFATQSMMRRD